MTGIAIIGASGAVGRQMLVELMDSPCIHSNVNLGLFASPKSSGQKVRFNHKELIINSYDIEKLKEFDYVLMSAGSDFALREAKAMVEYGITVIDNSSAFRMDPDVPLVIPELNGKLVDNWDRGIIANPNCSTIQMLMAIKPLMALYSLKLIVVATYQSVSGSGHTGIATLKNQLQGHQSVKEGVDCFPQSIANNVLSAIGHFEPGQNCEEEEKMVQESRKILAQPSLQVLASCARVPVIFCHCEAINVQFEGPIEIAAIKKAWSSAAGLCYVETNAQSELPSPKLCKGKKEVFISRLRGPLGDHNSPWVQFWNVSDNLRKGAATNAVQILERILQQRGN